MNAARAAKPMLRESAFEELQRYVRFTSADLEELRAFHDRTHARFPAIAQQFYERIREHAEAHAVFANEEQIARQQLALIAWMSRICTTERSSEYFQRSAHIGRVHVNVGLPQRYVFSAMALIRVELERLSDEYMGARSERVRSAINRALDLELAVMVETYRLDFVARVQRIEQMERQNLGRKLERSEQRYQQAVELAPYLVIGLDAHGKIQLFNREASRVTGYELDEMLGADAAERLFENASDALAALSRKTAGGPDGPVSERLSLDGPLRTRSGSVRHMVWEVAHLASDDDATTATYLIGRDVTEDRALAERTRNVEKLAAVGTLAAGLAHEIRNPLNGAQLHLTFLSRGLKKVGANAETLEAVAVVSDEIRRLSTLVNEFLDFARPKPLNRKHVSLQALCEHVVLLVSADAEAAKVTVNADLPQTAVEADVDPGKIEQVLLNLMRNAIEAMEPSGGGALTLRLRRQPFFALIEVEDEGPGLPDPKAPIFDAFFSTKPSGTGLGLSIVHRIVTDHAGAISVDSRPGRTVFSVKLPL